MLRVLSLWDRFWGIKRFFILYCVAVGPDLGNAVPQTKSTGHSFALDSYQDVGFSLCFLQQQGQEFMALQGEMERAQLCPLLRDLSCLPVSPPPLFLGMYAVVRGKYCDSGCSVKVMCL